MWLIFWVISNVSTGFYSLDLSPRFYYWGYAWPLHHGTSTPLHQNIPSPFPFPPLLACMSKPTNPPAVVEASHQLLFDLHSRIGLNLAVLIIWSVVNTLLFAPACYLMRWEQMKAKQTEARKENEWLDAMSRQRSRIGIPK